MSRCRLCRPPIYGWGRRRQPIDLTRHLRGDDDRPWLGLRGQGFANLSQGAGDGRLPVTVQRAARTRQNRNPFHCVAQRLANLGIFRVFALYRKQANHELQVVAAPVIGLAKQQLVINGLS